MDGSYCFTICGDPLYFAPELVTQQGYDFGVDIWAFGILLYELYEGSSPFGTSETDETTIFRAISSYRPEKLTFKKAPAAAKKLIADVLRFSTEERCGYRDLKNIMSSDFFQGKKSLTLMKVFC
jgi:serine/threonine protein kinase